MALASILPLLARARESLERGYDALIQAASHAESIPCEAVTVYTRLRRELLRMEKRIVDEARKMNLHPPEDVPRSLALLGACPPGAGEVLLSEDAIALGQSYASAVKQRAQIADDALRAAYNASPEFADRCRQYVEAFAPYARAGTDEAAPAPPKNLALLRLVYFLGGSMWTVRDAEALLYSDIDVVPYADVETLWRQSGMFEQAAASLEEDVRPPPPFLPGWGWAALALGAVATTGTLVGVGLHLDKRASRQSHMEQESPWPDLPSGGDAHALPAHEGE